MKNLFPGHYKPTQEEFQKLWDNCIFAFDTNILLNVYRYSNETRERLFETLDLLKDRIWIPYQVAYEYHEERLNVISHQLQPYKEIQKVLDDNLEKLNSVIDNYRNRHSFTSLVDDKNIINTTKRANKRISKILEETKAQYPNLIDNDIYRDRIDNLFLNKIGSPNKKEKVEKVYEQIKTRFEQEMPPGYKDKNKSKDHEKYGDAILWLQLIEYIKTQNKPIIFVTDDNKEDW
ncbi:MAG: PIN domain-containing protein [Xenococcus sp. MO_188.B8]|nr:PIN domain-containing protein [Xenococcus sp. MO_188.B8]